MISRRESKRRSGGIKRICRNEKGSIVFSDKVEYDAAFLCLEYFCGEGDMFYAMQLM